MSPAFDNANVNVQGNVPSFAKDSPSFSPAQEIPIFSGSSQVPLNGSESFAAQEEPEGQQDPVPPVFGSYSAAFPQDEGVPVFKGTKVASSSSGTSVNPDRKTRTGLRTRLRGRRRGKPTTSDGAAFSSQENKGESNENEYSFGDTSAGATVDPT